MENRSNNCKTQSNNRTSTSSRSTNAATQRAQAPQPVHQGRRRRGRKEPQDHRQQVRQELQELPLRLTPRRPVS